MKPEEVRKRWIPLIARSGILVLIAVYSVVLFSSLQKPKILWEQAPSLNGESVAYSVIETDLNGFIIAGKIRSYDSFNTNLLLAKIDSSGEQEWHITAGGAGDDWASAVVKADDGGFLAAGGITSSGSGQSGVYLVKFDAQGSHEWEKEYAGSGNTVAHDIQKISDGSGYIVTGRTGTPGSSVNNIYLLKTDLNGNILWEKVLGGQGNETGYSVRETNDGGCIIAGATDSYGQGYWDVFLVKTNSLGQVEWQQTYGGSGYDYARAVIQTKDGGYLVAGSTYSFGLGNQSIYLVKTDTLGRMEWVETFGGEKNDWASSVLQTKDGGFLVAGGTLSYGDNAVAYLLKVNASGKLQWEETFGEAHFSQAHEIYQTAKGDYIVVAETVSAEFGESSIYLVRFK